MQNLQFKESALLMFHEETNAFNMVVRPQGYTQCVYMFTRKFHWATLS